MAKKLSELAEEIDNNHNQGPTIADDVRDAICRLHNDLTPHEDRLKAVQGEIKKLFREFKAETGLNIQDFKYQRKLVMMQDEGEREEKIENMKLIFSALDDFTEWLNENDTDT